MDNTQSYHDTDHTMYKVAIHKDQLPTNPEPDQAWRLGAAPGVNDNFNCLREIIDKYPELYPINLKP